MPPTRGNAWSGVLAMEALNNPLGLLPNHTAAHRDATANAVALYLRHTREYAADPAATGDIEQWAAGRDHRARPVPAGYIGPWASERDYAAERDRLAHGSRADHVGHGGALIAAANRQAEADY